MIMDTLRSVIVTALFSCMSHATHCGIMWYRLQHPKNKNEAFHSLWSVVIALLWELCSIIERLCPMMGNESIFFHNSDQEDIIMELRVLHYFLTIAREQSISGAAEFLHISQPTLSRQMKDMEDELGKQLFVRSNRKITLTQEGRILRKRAEEILDLVKKTEDEITLQDNVTEGDLYIGAGETHAVSVLIHAVQQLQKQQFQLRLHISSGDTKDVLDDLDKGLIDFGLVFGIFDKSKYDYIELPCKDTYGILMRKDSELAEKDVIVPEDLWDKPLICSRNSKNNEDNIFQWLQKDPTQLNIIATFNLLYNGSVMVENGIGYSFALDNIIHISDESSICFKPLEPPLRVGMTLIWKKYQIFSKASEKFLKQLQTVIANMEKDT